VSPAVFQQVLMAVLNTRQRNARDIRIGIPEKTVFTLKARHFISKKYEIHPTNFKHRVFNDSTYSVIRFGNLCN
jgi:hypothetical protein